MATTVTSNDSLQLKSSSLGMENHFTTLGELPCQGSSPNGVTKENGLFMLEKRLLFYRKGYDRSEKRHGAREKGHGATRKGHGAAPF